MDEMERPDDRFMPHRCQEDWQRDTGDEQVEIRMSDNTTLYVSAPQAFRFLRMPREEEILSDGRKFTNRNA